MDGLGTIEQRLKDEVRVLRNLPPGSPLRAPADVEARSLLQDLMTLPVQQDPVEWMHSKRLAESGRVTFRWAVHNLRTLFEAGVRLDPAALAGVGPDEAVLHVIHALFQAGMAKEVELLVARDQHAKGDAEQLFSTLRKLIQSSIPSPPISPKEHQQFLLDLLWSSGDSDPVGWITAERARFAVVLTLGGVIDQAVPHLDQHGEVLDFRALAIAINAGMLEVSIQRFVRYEAAFALHATVRVLGGRPASASSSAQVIRWRGFDRVSDDSGNSYFVYPDTDRHTIQNGGLQPISMSFFPAPAAHASSLFFESKPAILEVRTLTFEHAPQSSEVQVGEGLSWELSLLD